MTKISLMNLTLFILIMLIIFMLTKIHTSHPIMTMLLIIPYNILLIINMSSWKMNFMYSIMMFMMMISGLLIMFMYFTSLIANTQMYYSINIYLMLSLLFLLIIVSFMFIYKKLFILPLTYQTKENLEILYINNKPFTNITNLYNYPFNYFTILTMSYLIMSLFSIIKMISTKSKPLRKP